MAQVVLLVEGRTDQVFWNQLLRLHGSSYDVREPLEGKYSVRAALEALLRAGTARIAVALDVDRDTPEEVVEKVRGDLSSITKQRVAVDAQGRLHSGESIIGPVPMGLHGDSELTHLAISSYSMEDYLVKLLLTNPSRSSHPQNVRDVSIETLGLLGRYGIHLASAKQWFQLLKPIVGLPANDTGAIEKLFHDYPEALKAMTLPLVSALQLLEAP